MHRCIPPWTPLEKVVKCCCPRSGIGNLLPYDILLLMRVKSGQSGQSGLQGFARALLVCIGPFTPELPISHDEVGPLPVRPPHVAAFSDFSECARVPLESEWGSEGSLSFQLVNVDTRILVPAPQSDRPFRLMIERSLFSLASSSICKNLTGLGWLRKSFKIREGWPVLGLRSWAGISLSI
jgi:hypothetical protein